MNVELHIERLVLDGLTLGLNHRAEVQAAVEVELTRLLAAEGLRAELLSGGAIRSVGAPGINVAVPIVAGHLGNHIARAVYGGIGAPQSAKTR